MPYYVHLQTNFGEEQTLEDVKWQLYDRTGLVGSPSNLNVAHIFDGVYSTYVEAIGEGLITDPFGVRWTVEGKPELTRQQETSLYAAIGKFSGDLGGMVLILGDVSQQVNSLPTGQGIAAALLETDAGLFNTPGTVGGAISRITEYQIPAILQAIADLASSGLGLSEEELENLNSAVARINAVAGEDTDPIVIIPEPPDDLDACFVYAYFETIDNQVPASREIVFELDCAGPAATDRVLVERKVVATIDTGGRLRDANGNTYVQLQRNDYIRPEGTQYLVSCRGLGMDAFPITLTSGTFDLASVV